MSASDLASGRRWALESVRTASSPCSLSTGARGARPDCPGSRNKQIVDALTIGEFMANRRRNLTAATLFDGAMP